MLSRQEGSTTRHLASAQHWTGLAGGDTGRLFLTFGGPVCTDRISYCPLDRVLTYKNLIYLLNLQICGFHQVVSEVREPPPERVPALLSDSSVLNPGIVDVAPDFTVSAPYNPAMYTYQPTTGKERQNSVEIVSLLGQSNLI